MPINCCQILGFTLARAARLGISPLWPAAWRRPAVVIYSVPDRVSGMMTCGQTCERSQHLDVIAHVSLRLAQQMKPLMKGSIVAQKIQTVFIDDLDGSEAEGTVRFGLDGAEYEIDLNAEHARALRDALTRYVQAARRPGRGARRPTRSGRRARADGVDSTEVREWAKAQGIDVKDRGRVPAELVVKFKAATTQ
jgi:hypothetical protein